MSSQTEQDQEGAALLTTLRYSPASAEPWPLFERHVARLVHAFTHFTIRAARTNDNDGDGDDGGDDLLHGLTEGIDREHGATDPRQINNPANTYPLTSNALAAFHTDIDSLASAPAGAGKSITLDPHTSTLPRSPTATTTTTTTAATGPRDPIPRVDKEEPPPPQLEALLRSFPGDMYRFKTTHRHAYDAAAERGRTRHPNSDPPVFDTLLHFRHTTRTSLAPARASSSRTTVDSNINIHDSCADHIYKDDDDDADDDLITELTTSNIAIYSPSSLHAAQWITPRLAPRPSSSDDSNDAGAPFLRGVTRTYLLALDKIREADITVREFRRLVREEGRAVVGMNGLRGVWLANPIFTTDN
ncbi:hypothetical protein QFC21_003675 [Naganishia friedmannii]|uniref:Uncharacterized protein n=1 Tax=Naganishia friedmannii TaxID=89922 RepID=A0ACC2VPS9_9TREE|nr:hypothetical protein QFC21_003675 [Naganishia friedmannii]